ncbi:HAD-IA family hydrolase [uncultured Psychrobacillus sp.]|uniref:HAD family hydrolase n=1 Tax=uncultured Psychrobacillus sp. TaxID=1551585 RepID=UPI002623788D|nr:HAD-IA family hydrolase [uncultured Psychrobacillus sp.]
MVKAVIFDLDDTLISEREYIESGYRHISKLLCEKLNIDELDIYLLLMELFKESSVKVFNRFFDKLEVSYSRKDITELVEEYRNHLPNIMFNDEVLACLEFLKRKGIKVGIITDGYANAQRQKLKAIGAINYFDHIIVTDELGRDYWKPHPKAFEIMKEALDIEYREIIYVGDNPKKDFYISSIYPIKTIRIKRENGIYTINEYFQGIKENITISSFKEIVDLLNLKTL